MRQTPTRSLRLRSKWKSRCWGRGNEFLRGIENDFLRKTLPFLRKRKGFPQTPFRRKNRFFFPIPRAEGARDGRGAAVTAKRNPRRDFWGLFGAGSEEKRKAKVLLRGIRERLRYAKVEAMWRYAHDCEDISLIALCAWAKPRNRKQLVGNRGQKAENKVKQAEKSPPRFRRRTQKP